MSAGEARLAVKADLYDAYQSRLNDALRALIAAEANRFTHRRAELAALAEGYFWILAPAYQEQNGTAALNQAAEAFAGLRAEAVSTGDLKKSMEAVDAALQHFHAAPLSPAEQSRRAGKLLRFVSLVPIEYDRGVANGQVIHDFEIQEAITFHEAASGTFSELEDLLAARDPGKTAQVAELMESLTSQLAESSRGEQVADPGEIRSTSDAIHALLTKTMPDSWLKGSTQGDFEVIGSLLDQVETAVRAGDYRQAEAARLEAYAVMETGPEARLVILDPQLTIDLEGLFWNGHGKHTGLAALIKEQAYRQEIEATLTELAARLAEAQERLGQSTAPAAIAMNAGIIVFREGLEAVVILASLMSSLRSGRERTYRRPMWLGTALALLATALTWFLARGVLQSLARFGEKLEAIVSLIAIGVLLVIMNWFFHKVYWTGWIAKFHSQKRRLISGEAGLLAGLVVLGFTSVYREGFETVLFLQALVLEVGTAVVLSGAAAGLLTVLLIGIGAFRLQVNLPYRDMLVITGILIGGVLLQMVGKTVYALQVVGWMPIHAIQAVSLPYWLGMWFGIYPTWEGVLLQAAAVGMVIGSYYLAEWMQKRRRLARAY
jgi:high-affinity iron transporter